MTQPAQHLFQGHPLKRKTYCSMDSCTQIGKTIGQRCLENNINEIVFDKNGNLYHGRVKALLTVFVKLVLSFKLEIIFPLYYNLEL